MLVMLNIHMSEYMVTKLVSDQVESYNLLGICIGVNNSSVLVKTKCTALLNRSSCCVVGIEVRTNDSTFFMHHKFAIVDEQRMMTGSFNWSRNAMLGNDENVMLIRTKRITSQYLDVFKKLWAKYNPDGQKS